MFDNTRFEAITRKLGKPLGDYVDDGDGGYSREFEHLKVHVNIETRQGTLTVKDERVPHVAMMAGMNNLEWEVISS